jgi:RND family efflux transporter MFP subunit
MDMRRDMTTTYGRWWMGASAVLMAAAVAGCGSAEANGAQGSDGEEFVRVINVEVMELRPSTFVEEIRLTAVATANQDVMVAAEESGVIRQILVDKGARVREGQEIAKIDDSVLRAQVAQAQAQADLAAQTWERRKRLWEEDRVGSEIAYLEAKFAREQTAANLQALQERLARTTIRAPFSGVLDERLVELGSMVGPSQPVARVVDLNPIKVVAGVPERYAADVRVGAAAQVSFDVLPGQTFEAPIRYVGVVVDPQNRTFPVEIVLPNASRLIKPEMVANVVVARRTVEDATVVPQDALVRVQDGYVVFVVEQGSEGAVVASRPVRLGPTRRNLVVVESGVEVGESLVVVGQKSVAAGDRVSVVGTRVQGEG